MPLERIHIRATGSQSEPVRYSRWRLAALTGVILASSLLAACSGDSSREAERGRQADASQESVVKDLQATETWLIVNSTPEATASPEEE